MFVSGQYNILRISGSFFDFPQIIIQFPSSIIEDQLCLESYVLKSVTHPSYTVSLVILSGLGAGVGWRTRMDEFGIGWVMHGF